MLLSTYGDRGRYKFNEDSRGTELDELSTIHKPKAKVMSCSNTTHFTSSLVSTQLVRGSPSTADQSDFFHLFQLWTGCAENGDFFCPTTCTDQVLPKNPVEHLARTQHWLTKEKPRLIKSSLTGACSRWLCEGGSCFFKQWAACHPQNLH